jgi:predicted esterase
MSTAPTNLFVLHGHDSNEESALHLAANLDPRQQFEWHCPLGEVHLQDGGLAWFDPVQPLQVKHSAQQLREKIRAANETARTIVVGWSQGAAVALAALAAELDTAPPHVERLVILSGFLFEHPHLEYDLHALAETNILVVHGTEDEVVSAVLVDGLVETLRASGARVSLRWIRGAGHQLGKQTIEEVAGWLRQDLPPRPEA